METEGALTYLKLLDRVISKRGLCPPFLPYAVLFSYLQVHFEKPGSNLTQKVINHRLDLMKIFISLLIVTRYLKAILRRYDLQVIKKLYFILDDELFAQHHLTSITD